MRDIIVRKRDDHTGAKPVHVDQFLAKGSAHRPRTTVDIRHDQKTIHLHFTVEDRYVRAVSTRYHDCVWCDSCVEFFVQPRPDHGYFNFEFSAGGHFLVSYITDPTRVGNQFKAFVKVPWERAQVVRVEASHRGIIDPEITGPVTWTVTAEIPVALLSYYTGALGPLSGQRWRGNFYKCGDRTSHPHWGAWSPILSGESFHQPAYFGALMFA